MVNGFHDFVCFGGALPLSVIQPTSGLAAGGETVRIKDNMIQCAERREHGIMLYPARRGHDRMPVQNDKSFSRFLCQFFQSPAQFPILAGKRFMIKTAKFLERRRFDENKRAVKHPPAAEPDIQDRHHEFGVETLFIPAKGRAAGDAFAGLDFFRHVGKQSRAGMGIGVHEDQPVAGRRRRT